MKPLDAWVSYRDTWRQKALVHEAHVASADTAQEKLNHTKYMLQAQSAVRIAELQIEHIVKMKLGG